MTKSRHSKSDEHAFTAVLAKYAPRATFSSENVARDAAEIMRTARGIQRLAVEDCNRPLLERERKRWRALDLSIGLSLARYGATVTTHGDPRGCVVKIKFKDGERHDDFGGEGLWCL